jgi:hypothetical protein
MRERVLLLDFDFIASSSLSSKTVRWYVSPKGFIELSSVTVTKTKTQARDRR